MNASPTAPPRTAQPQAPPPPPPRRSGNVPPAQQQGAPRTGSGFRVSNTATRTAEKVVLFGCGGVGKSTLAAALGQVGVRPVFIDLDDGANHLSVDRVEGVVTWDDLLAALRDETLWGDVGAVVIDSLTAAEEMAIAWTLANVKHEKGHTVKSIEGYGYGKGYTFVFETFLHLLAALDQHARVGRHVVCTAHDCTANVPNPAGDDWLRYEPRLQSPPSGKGSIRHRVKEWCDHLLFVGYDVHAEDGKARGAGTRTIYPCELPTHLAKSRTLAEPIEFERGSLALWQQLLQRKGQ